MDELISVCMATHNRKRQLKNSLKALEIHAKDLPVEIIIVDDNSDETFTKKELSKYKLNIKYKIRRDRSRQDPVIPNNMAFDMAKGSIFVMSCGEILIAENILKHAFESITDDNYICYSVYSFGQDQLDFIDGFNNLKKINELITILSQTCVTAGAAPGWYIHPQYRPVALPFCAAISKRNMEKLSGYDERFMFGVGHADDDFLRRIYDLKLQVSILEHPWAVHQPHQLTDYSNLELVKLNLDIYNEQANSKNIKAENNIIYKR